MKKELTLDSDHFCRLIQETSKTRQVKKIIVRSFGRSMTPFVRHSSLLTIDVASKNFRIRVGDMIALTQPGWDKIIVHRVIRSKGSRLQTKGDNNPKADEWISKESIIGRITKVETPLGKKYSPGRWNGFILALLSRTLILNMILLPLARYLKNRINTFSGKGHD